MDIAKTSYDLQRHNQVKAVGIEFCSCPEGYSGTSCEKCSNGYVRAYNGYYFGACEKVTISTLEPTMNSTEIYSTLSTTTIMYPRPEISGQSTYRVEAGKRIIIEPIVKAIRPAYSWLKDGKIVSYEKNLVLHQVKQEDAGAYTLIVTDIYSKAQKDYHIYIFRRPSTSVKRIIIEDDREISVVPGDTLLLECRCLKVESTDKIRITTFWFKGVRGARRRFPSHVRSHHEVLQIIKARPSDSSKYTCVQSSSNGQSKTAIIELRVQDSNTQIDQEPIEVKISGPNKKIETGDSLTLRCFTNLLVPPNYDWLHKGIFIQRGDVLTVKDVSLDQAGYYTCRVRHSDGSFLGEASTQIDIIEKTKENDDEIILDISPQNLRVKTGEDAQFTCHATATNQNYRYLWSREDASKLPQYSYQQNEHLILRNLAESDSGVYVCAIIDRVNNQMLAQSKSRLVVETPFFTLAQTTTTLTPETALSVQIRNITGDIYEGDDVKLYCIIDGGYDNKIEWYRYNTHEIISTDSPLHVIKKITKDESGYYSCNVKSKSGNEQNAYVYVQVRPKVPPRLKFITGYSGPLEQGHTVYFSCRAEQGEPVPVIEWVRDNNRPFSKKAEFNENNDYFLLRDVTPDDAGTYTCIGRNSAGEQRESITIEVKPSETLELTTQTTTLLTTLTSTVRPEVPILIQNRPYVQAPEGSDVKLECRVKNSENVVFTWTKNDQYVGSGDMDGSLILKQVSTSDSGLYKCLASNNYASAFINIRLQVNPRQELPKINVSPKTQTISIGQDFDFTCSTNSRDVTSYTWYRNNQPIISSSTLRLTNIQLSDDGIYTCLIDTPNGQISDTVRLVVIEKESNTNFAVYIKPNFKNFDNSGQYKFGPNASIECSTRETDIEDLRWVGLDFPIKPSVQISSTSESSILTFRNFLPMHQGTYVCIATKANGQTSQSSIELKRVPNAGAKFTYKIIGYILDENYFSSTTPAQTTTAEITTSTEEIEDYNNNEDNTRFDIVTTTEKMSDIETTNYPLKRRERRIRLRCKPGSLCYQKKNKILQNIKF